jgi:hypothetical protein
MRSYLIVYYNIEVSMSVGLFPVERGAVSCFEVQVQNERRVRQWLGDGGEMPRVPLPPDAARQVRLPAGRHGRQKIVTWRQCGSSRTGGDGVN